MGGHFTILLQGGNFPVITIKEFLQHVIGVLINSDALLGAAFLNCTLIPWNVLEWLKLQRIHVLSFPEWLLRLAFSFCFSFLRHMSENSLSWVHVTRCIEICFMSPYDFNCAILIIAMQPSIKMIIFSFILDLGVIFQIPIHDFICQSPIATACAGWIVCSCCLIIWASSRTILLIEVWQICCFSKIQLCALISMTCLFDYVNSVIGYRCASIALFN